MQINSPVTVFSVARRPNNYYCIKYVMVTCQLIAIVAQVIMLVLGYTSLEKRCKETCVINTDQLSDAVVSAIS